MEALWLEESPLRLAEPAEVPEQLPPVCSPTRLLKSAPVELPSVPVPFAIQSFQIPKTFGEQQFEEVHEVVQEEWLLSHSTS